MRGHDIKGASRKVGRKHLKSKAIAYHCNLFNHEQRRGAKQVHRRGNKDHGACSYS